jgi:UDP-N-acetylglucosamine 3-dehydrogenase
MTHTSSRSIRVGVIGSGSIARSHLEALKALSTADIVAHADLNLDAARECAETYGGEAFADYRDLLKSSPEAIVICTPGKLHPEHAIAALEAGAHVLCEKPLAITIEECDRMIDAARDAGRKLMVGQVLRYYPGPMTLINVAKSGRLGRIVTCWSTRIGWYGMEGAPRWRFNPASEGGGTALEWEPHEIDLLRMIGGEATSVTARTACTREEAPGFDDFIHAVIDLGDGVIGRIDAGNSSMYEECSRGVIGTEGAAWCGWGDVSVKIKGSDEVETISANLSGIPDGVTPGMYLQDGKFLDAIINDTDVPIPGEEGRANVAVALAMLESGQTMQSVDLS